MPSWRSATRGCTWRYACSSFQPYLAAAISCRHVTGLACACPSAARQACCIYVLPWRLTTSLHVASPCFSAPSCRHVQQDHLDIRVIPSFQEVEKEDRNGEKHTMTAVKLQASMAVGQADGIGLDKSTAGSLHGWYAICRICLGQHANRAQHNHRSHRQGQVSFKPPRLFCTQVVVEKV